MFVVERFTGITTDADEPGLAPIGVVGLCHWDAVNASAEVSFYIGDEAARGKGYASRALLLLHRWGFDALGLHRLWGECYDFNLPGQNILRALGYSRAGMQRHTVRRDGAWVSSVFYDLLEDEWHAR
jgi:RimJ/RimL family protein N-acetyltransferase